MKIHKRLISVALCFCLLLGIAPAVMAAGETYYVSSSGDDSNSGGLSDPFATIAAAYAAISNSGTIRVIDDISIEEKIAFTEDKTVTVTGGGVTAIYTSSLNISNGNDGLFSISAGSVIFEDITIKMPDIKGTNGRLLYVGANAFVTLGNGATLANGYLAYSGGGVLVDGSFIMLPGSVIRDCYVANNTTAFGGGVYVREGSFTMQGGEISGNTIHTTGAYESFGGGVAVGPTGEFRMEGGVITGNTADTAGGGVYVASANGTSVSGSASVSGNSLSGSSRENNIFLPEGVSILIANATTGLTGLTCANPDYLVVVGSPEGYAIQGSDEDGFFYDTGEYDIRLINDELVLYYFTVNVTLNIEDLSSRNTGAEAPINLDYDTTLVPDSGFKLPGEVAIYIGGSKLDKKDYYYNNETGELHIPGALVTGDIAIEAYGSKEYSIHVAATNVITDNEVSSIPVEQFTTTIINVSAAPHYAVPDSINVIGSCDYTYAGGVLTITNVTSNITVEIDGAEIPHQITFDPNGGTVSPTQKIINESSILIGELPVPVRTGYTFIGWYSFGGTRVTAETENYLTDDLQLTARWSADTNISYVLEHYIEYVDSGLNPGYSSGGLISMTHNGVTKRYYLYTSKSYNDGIADGTRTVADLLLDEYDNLPISGLSPSGANEYEVTMLPDGTSVFPIYYDRMSYTVTFDPNGGAVNVAEQETDVVFGSIYGLLPDATKTGYTLIGWFTQPNGGELVNASDPYLIAENQTLYAHWQASGEIAYKIVHMLQKLDDNIVGYEKTTVNYDIYATDDLRGTADLTAYVYALAITGYIPSPENTYETEILPDGSTVHYLFYDRIITDVSYDSNGGASVGYGSRLYYGGSFSSLPAAPARTGYVFVGWYVGLGEEARQVTAGTEINDINPAAKTSITLYAHWTPRSYDLVFQTHGGTLSGGKSVTYDKPIGVLPTASLTGYIFQAWYLEDTLLDAPSGAPVTAETVANTDSVITIESGIEKVKTLYAWYLPVQATITFDVNGGIGFADNTRTATYDAPYGELPIPTRTGYTFMGWFFSDGTQLKATTRSTLLADSTVFARWEPNVYRVSLDVNGGNALEPDFIAVTYDSTYINLPIATKTGYNFQGWFTSLSDGTRVESNDQVAITAPQTLFAQWSPKSFIITFDANGGELSGQNTTAVAYDSRYGNMPMATRSGYTFSGWFTQRTGGERITSDSIVRVLENTTLYAQWTTSGSGGGAPAASSFTITATASPGAVMNPIGAVSVQKGEDMSFSFSAMHGYIIADILVDGESVGRTIRYTFESVSANHSIEAKAIPLFGAEIHKAYIKGRGDGLIHPEAAITRAEIATIFFRLLSDEARTAFKTTRNPFTDVFEDAWFCEAVSTLTAMGILKGYDNGTFGANAPITRAELAAIVSRFTSNSSPGQTRFPDTAGHWAEAEINIIADNGWVLGYPDGFYRPENSITRAEAIAIINRILNRTPSDKSSLLPGMIVWPDNPESAWYYIDIQEASQTHTGSIGDDGSETWIQLH